MKYMNDTSTLEQRMIHRAKQQKVPINGSLELFPLCNMDCDMCYVRLNRAEMEKKGQLRTTDEWIELARQMEKAGVLFLLLTGGEPLLFPDFKKLYLELRKMGMILTINTNGTLIDEEWADFFGKHKPRRINVTLYGANEDTYSSLCHYPEGFMKTIKGIQLLRKRGVDVKVSCSITKANYNDIEKIFAIGKELDVPVHIDPYMMPAVREREIPFDEQSRITPEEAARISLDVLKIQFSKDFFRQYVEQSIARVQDQDFPRGDGHISCLAGNCSFTINWQGEMRPCVVMSEPSVSVFDTGFESAWKEICSNTQQIMINTKCIKCHLRPLCKVCAAASMLETGQYDGIPDYLCRYSEETYRLLLQEAKNYG